MRQRLALLLVVLPLVACAPKNLSPEGQRAFTALQVTQRVGEFQNAVIAASDAKKIPVEQSRVIVRWTVSSLEVLKTAPQGWDASLRQTWVQVRPVVANLESIGPWAITIDLLLGVQ